MSRRVLSFGSPIRPHSVRFQDLPDNHTKGHSAVPLRADGAPRLGHPPIVTLYLSFVLVVALGLFGESLPVAAFDPSEPAIEVLSHEWHPDTVWERIGRTKFVWKATVRNNSDARKRVFVYYDLLDADNVPVARTVANRYIEPHQTVEILSDSYIETVYLPKVKNSRATVKVGLQ
jgi:hypothetical protein